MKEPAGNPSDFSALFEILDVFRRDEPRPSVDIGVYRVTMDSLYHGRDTKLTHLRGILRDARTFRSGLDRFKFAATGVKTHRNDFVVGNVRVSERFDGSGNGRTTGRVDRLQIRIGRQDVFGDGGAEFESAVGSTLGRRRRP